MNFNQRLMSRQQNEFPIYIYAHMYICMHIYICIRLKNMCLAFAMKSMAMVYL